MKKLFLTNESIYKTKQEIYLNDLRIEYHVLTVMSLQILDKEIFAECDFLFSLYPYSFRIYKVFKVIIVFS